MAPRHLFLVVLATAGLVTTGCVTGERPTLAEEPVSGVPVGDPSVDAVLSRFELVADETFTADYEITNNFGPVTREATVVHDDEGRRSITIGDVRFLLERTSSTTCDLSAGEPCANSRRGRSPTASSKIVSVPPARRRAAPTCSRGSSWCSPTPSRTRPVRRFKHLVTRTSLGEILLSRLMRPNELLIAGIGAVAGAAERLGRRSR